MEEKHYQGIAQVYHKLSGCEKVEFLPYHIYGASKAQALGEADRGIEEWIPSKKQMESAYDYLDNVVLL